MNGKYGLLEFKYNGFEVFEERLRNAGSYTVNLGDNIQSIAVRALFENFGIKEDQIISINRDDLPNYRGPEVALVTNGVFLQGSFPIPQQITPIFIGLHVEAGICREHHDYFKRHEPIGCRDVTTRDLFKRQGIDAYTSGCLTLTLPRRPQAPTNGKVFIVYGDQGRPPDDLLACVPKALLDSAEFVFQRMPVSVFPLGEQEVGQANNLALDLLRRYRDEATLVITSLLHAATPCVALGIPVILARNDDNPRFTALSRIIPLYTPEKFQSIDWNPKIADVEIIKHHLVALTKVLLQTGSGGDVHATALDDIFNGRLLV